jgi:hypothetical protein
VYVIAKPCPTFGVCGAVGRRALTYDKPEQCDLDEHYDGLEQLLAMPWTQ